MSETASKRPPCAALYAPAVLHGTASFELEPLTPDEMTRRRAALIEQDFPYPIAEVDGVRAGIATPTLTGLAPLSICG